MKILLVDDNAADAEAIALALKQLRHEVFATQNGNDALDHYIRHRPDLVVTAPFIPGIDGFTLTREVLHHAAPRWQPVVFLLDAADETLEARAIEVGADACFCKPVTANRLGPRLAAIGQLLRVQEDADLRLAELRRQFEALQADREAARHLIEYQMASPDGRPLDDPALQWWRHAARRGSDMLLAARTPGGCLHLLLADAGGGGLAACIILQALIAPFHRLTGCGTPLPALVRELNRTLRRVLPPGHVVAAQLACVDPHERWLSVWNGAMPPAFMLDAAGHPCREFPLTHAALGALDEADFDDRTDLHAFGPAEQLVMVSDGVLEAIGANGERFGEEGLAATLVGLPRDERQAALAAALGTHLSGIAPGDDMTLVLVDGEKGLPPLDLPPPGPPHPGQAGNWCVALRLDGPALRQVDVVPLLLGVIDHFPAARARRAELFAVLNDLFGKALDQDLLRLDPRLRHSPDGLETWLLLREERLAALGDGEDEIRLWVEQGAPDGQPRLRVRCQDREVHIPLARAGTV